MRTHKYTGSWRRMAYGIPIAIGITLLSLSLASCSVSYKFNGASIDYTKTKTIQIADFPIRSSYVWGPMASIFNNQLKDQFANPQRGLRACVHCHTDLRDNAEPEQRAGRAGDADV